MKNQLPLSIFWIIDSPSTHKPALKIKIPKIEINKKDDLPFFKSYDFKLFSK